MVRDDAELELAGATDRAGAAVVGQDVGLQGHLGVVGVTVEGDFAAALTRSQAKVVIDFTSAEASLAHARVCAEKQVALVIGSTGFSAEQKEALRTFAAKTPVLLSPNMSVGVNLVIQTAAQLAKALGDGYDIEVVEAHHRMKKDAPSGTALRMAEEIAAAVGRTDADFRMSRQGQVGERPRREIGIQTLRGGDVVGEHTVLFLGDGERVELTHRATSRETFARGALRAAKWLASGPKKPGLYTMADVLGFGRAGGGEGA
jgi:4-hydroxy-tetrahydrodipicolinate reductase